MVIQRSAQSEIGNLRRLQLKLQFVCDQGDELRIRGFSLGITDCIPKEPLQGIQIPSVPGHFDGVADGPLHAAGGGLECFRHLWIQHLGDGIGGLAARQRGVLRTATTQEILRSSLLLSLLVNAPMLHRACSTIIVNPNIKVKFQTNEHLKKVFPEYFELFCARSRWDDSKCSHYLYFSTYIIWASSRIKSPSSIINCISKGEKFELLPFIFAQSKSMSYTSVLNCSAVSLSYSSKLIIPIGSRSSRYSVSNS